ncbi:hypothetical protein CRUP_033086 [Coryphaenoides rupestris]|nr:hypothetical protein CRUP_033086 [Coryphaenoides rupestris]
MEGSDPGFEEDQEVAGVELDEVRKLQELVRRLELQNHTLRHRGSNNPLRNGSHHMAAGSGNINERLSCEDVSPDTDLTSGHSADCELSPPQDSSGSSSSGDISPLPLTSRLGEEEEGETLGFGGPCMGFLTMPCSNGPDLDQESSQTPESPSQESYESETLAESDSGVDQSGLDDVDVLDLEDGCAEMDDEETWLCASPKMQVAEPCPESSLKWCRRVLDHPSPETKEACRALINRLDQASRWKTMYCSPGITEAAAPGSAGSGLTSPGYHKPTTNKPLLTCGSSGLVRMHSALSSQSSIDSELSTSDDSISMGYKLQDLTDVQIMARLQEESLRQDYATSSASVSRRSSSASLQSLRRGGPYSDQEFDSYSLEDEEEAYCPAPPPPQQQRHRFTPSPRGSPRCLSPSTPTSEHGGRLGASRVRAPRRSLQGPSPELLKFARSEEESRHSMPNLAPRTSLRSLEAVRNSRSMEANLQSSGNRMSRLNHSPSTGIACSSRLRASGQSPLSMRTPVKAVNPVGSMTTSRQPTRGLPVIQTPVLQSSGPANGGGGGCYVPGRASAGAGRPAASRGQTVPATRSKLSQPGRRSLGMTKASDDSWKDGCY